MTLSFGTVSAPVLALRHAPQHPSQNRAVFPTGAPFSPRVDTPTSQGFRPPEPDWGLSTKCSLFPSCRGEISPCFSLHTTRHSTSPTKSISCTPPLLHGIGRFSSSSKGATNDAPFKQFPSPFPPFTLEFARWAPGPARSHPVDWSRGHDSVHAVGRSRHGHRRRRLHLRRPAAHVPGPQRP